MNPLSLKDGPLPMHTQFSTTRCNVMQPHQKPDNIIIKTAERKNVRVQQSETYQWAWAKLSKVM